MRVRDQGSGNRDQGSGIRDQGSGIRDKRKRRKVCVEKQGYERDREGHECFTSSVIGFFDVHLNNMHVVSM